MPDPARAVSWPTTIFSSFTFWRGQAPIEQLNEAIRTCEIIGEARGFSRRAAVSEDEAFQMLALSLKTVTEIEERRSKDR